MYIDREIHYLPSSGVPAGMAPLICTHCCSYFGIIEASFLVHQELLALIALVSYIQFVCVSVGLETFLEHGLFVSKANVISMDYP